MSDMETAISCRALSKRYRIKTTSGEGGSRRRQEFWALQDVTFDVPVGEVFGVVGKNGAGKSTLLKILSRIVQPTTGHAVLRGRLAGLLEVGTGFHPELTGRENVFLNGTILGMSRREVQKQFDSIVEFAGVSYFLDTPIKRYSSGMYVRLAFAVAAHLQSEIMVLDEVLAVGDVAFQRKCLGKVRELAHDEGRTVLLVSHNTAVIKENATSALRLEGGRVTAMGSPADVLDAEALESGHEADLSEAIRADSNWGRLIRIVSASVADYGQVALGEDLCYSMVVDVDRPIAFGVGQALVDLEDQPLAASFGPLRDYQPGRHRIDVRVARPPLGPGRYAVTVAVGQSSFTTPDLHLDCVIGAVRFTVYDPAGEIDWHPEWWGAVALSTPRVEVQVSLV